MQWVKDYKSKLDWQWFTDPPTAHLWEYICLRANDKDAWWQGVEIKRGSFLTSYEKMSIATGLTIKQVRSSIHKLKSTGEITCKRAGKGQLVTVEKYDVYQPLANKEGSFEGSKKASETALTGQVEGNQRAVKGQLIKNNKIKEINKSKEIKEINRERIRTYAPEVQDAIHDFINMRVRMKKPLTDKAVKRLMDRLDKYADKGDGFDNVLAVKIINKSVDKGWTDIYEYKEDGIGDHKLSGQRTGDRVPQGDKGTEPRPTERQAETHLRGIRMAKVGDFGKTHSENTGTGTDEQKPVADAYRDRE